jgi:hypothetical protein
MKESSLVGCWLGSWLYVAAGIIIVASLRERKQFPRDINRLHRSGKLGNGAHSTKLT